MIPERARDLEPRTFQFAQRVRQFVNQLPPSPANDDDGRQLVRASGLLAANYLEVQEGLSRKDFFCRIKACRKEAREAGLWIRLLDLESAPELTEEREWLANESDELKRIFSSIAGKEDSSP